MPYVIRVDGKTGEVDKYYTPRRKKKKPAIKTGAGTNPGDCKKR